MNSTTVMNNLLNLIQSMALTASNKRWLADHLYEEAEIEERVKHEESLHSGWPKLRKSDLVISPKVANMFKVSEPLPEDFDEKKAYGEYLYEKYK